MGYCTLEVQAAEIRKGVETTSLKLSPLVCGGLRSTKTGYPSVQRGACYGVCGDIRDGVTSSQRVKRSTAVRQYENPAEVVKGQV